MARTGRPRKWTLKKAMKLADDLFDWLAKDPLNVFYEKFLIIEQGLYTDIINDMCERYPEFARAIRKANEIQRLKLLEGSNNKITSERIAQFVLQCKYGYTPTSKVEQNITGSPISIVFKEIDKG